MFLKPISKYSLFNDFSNVFDDFFKNQIVPSTFKLDVKENENEYIIEAELPGIKKEDVKLQYKDECLVISVNQVEEVKEDKENYLHRERRSSSMQRSIRLEDIAEEQVSAKLVDGILTIKAMKVEKPNNEIIIDVE